MNALFVWIAAHPVQYALAISLVTAANTVLLLHYLRLV